MTFDEAIKPLLAREGGYSNNKADRGGATNHGITQATFSDWLSKHGQGWRDVKSLTITEAAKIYQDNYWTPAKCDLLPDNLREIHFDASVNYGVSRATKLLQAAAGVKRDGVIGKNTLAAIAEMDGRLLKARYINERYAFYASIVERDRSQLVFIVGWLSRMRDFS